jgi:NAD(P)H-dependent FMN reductase
MNIGIITGSHRKASQSAKVGRFLSTLLETEFGAHTWIRDLGTTPLPLWDEDIWNDGPQWQQLKALSAQLTESDGVIIVAPEWHGMAPAAIKNFFLCVGMPELAHKPALACAVSAGEGGAYVIAELRMSSYKNTQNDADLQAEFGARAHYASTLLLAYAAALKPIREDTKIDHSRFMNGM